MVETPQSPKQRPQQVAPNSTASDGKISTYAFYLFSGIKVQRRKNVRKSEIDCDGSLENLVVITYIYLQMSLVDYQMFCAFGILLCVFLVGFVVLFTDQPNKGFVIFFFPPHLFLQSLPIEYSTMPTTFPPAVK